MVRNPSLAAALLRSWLALKTWVKVWLLFLNAVFLAALVFVPDPLAVWTLVAYVAAGPALAAIVIPQRGLTRLAGLGHLVPWTPLVAYLFARLVSDLAGPRLRVEDQPALTGYAALLATVTLMCLAFDAIDVLRFWRGERYVMGSPDAVRARASAPAPVLLCERSAA